MTSSSEAPSSDWIDIHRLLSRYPREVDRRDVEAVMTCFTSDAHLSFNDGAATADGEAEMLQFWKRLFEGGVLGEASTHLLTNFVIEIDGDQATASSQGVAYILRGETVYARGITYEDELARTPDGWRLSSRKHSAQWQAETSGISMQAAK